MSALNGFRVAADLVHLYGSIFLITGMVTSSSCISFSLRLIDDITSLVDCAHRTYNRLIRRIVKHARSIELYCIVFVTRYLDLDVTLGQWGKSVLGTYNILGLRILSCFDLLHLLSLYFLRHLFVRRFCASYLYLCAEDDLHHCRENMFHSAEYDRHIACALQIREKLQRSRR